MGLRQAVVRMHKAGPWQRGFRLRLGCNHRRTYGNKNNNTATPKYQSKPFHIHTSNQ